MLKNISHKKEGPALCGIGSAGYSIIVTYDNFK